MIYCKLTDLKRYEGLSKNLKIAFDFITSTDLNSLPIGRTEIQGSEIYINKSQIELSDEVSFETHRRYIDIHIDLECQGCADEEVIESAYENLTVTKPYDDENDYELLKVKSDENKSTQITSLSPGFCAIYFPGEAHKPGLINRALSSDKADQPLKLIKCVAKVLDDTKSKK